MSGRWNMSDGGGLTEAIGFLSGSTSGTTITASGSTNTKGSYTQLVASSDFDASGFFIRNLGGTVIANILVDIAIGSATEQTIVLNYPLDHGKSSVEGGRVFIPVGIPGGTRISARIQSSVASATANLVVTLVSRGFGNMPSFGRCTVYGADTSDSGGTQVDPGATINTKGSYSEIISSTTNDIKALTIVIGRNGNNGMSSYRFGVDLAIGASSSEEIIINDFGIVSSTGFDLLSPREIGPFPVNIPSGTRLAARAQCSGDGTTDRVFDIAILAFD